ncbi:MAG: cytochrome c oxidase subunit II [Chloroflexi bacterium]|nr:cytochrome c oxidase subunit II [Chloroflexota bacterium]
MSIPRRTRPMPQILVAALVIAVVVAFVVVAIAVGVDLSRVANEAIGGLFPPIAVTEQGTAIRELYTIVFLIAAVIFFVVEGLIVWTVLRYRRKPGDVSLPPQTHGNMLAEVLWTVIPTIIVAFLFIISWGTLNTVDTVSATPDTKIRAVAGQFQWTFDYLPADFDPDATPLKEPLYTEFVPTGEDGGMVVPAGRTVQLYLNSPDVIHAFYVPQFLFKRDVVPGRTNVFDFKINAADVGQTFRGQCAELCGAGHRIMLFDVHAVTATEFDTWLAEKIAAKDASPSPPPSGAPPASGGPAAGPAIQIAAKDVAFSTATLTAAAGQPLTIEFDNQDAQPHNVAIHRDSPTGAEVYKGEIFTGPAKKTYEVPPLEAGTYGFVCTVHPTMTGTLTVE